MKEEAPRARRTWPGGTVAGAGRRRIGAEPSAARRTRAARARRATRVEFSHATHATHHTSSTYYYYCGALVLIYPRSLCTAGAILYKLYITASGARKKPSYFWVADTSIRSCVVFFCCRADSVAAACAARPASTMATDASSAGSSPAVLFTDLFSVESLNAEGASRCAGRNPRRGRCTLRALLALLLLPPSPPQASGLTAWTASPRWRRRRRRR